MARAVIQLQLIIRLHINKLAFYNSDMYFVRLVFMLKWIFILFIFFVASADSHAQTSATANHTLSLSISNAIDLSFTQGGSGVGLSFSTTSNYANGVSAANAATIQVRSNRGYIVSVKSSAANFTSTSATAMPVNNILFLKESNQSSYLNLSSTDQTLLSGQTQGSNSFSVTYKATPGFNYDAGTYTVNVIYTATQQ